MSVDLKTFNDLVSRLEQVADRLEKTGGGGSGGGSASAAAPEEAEIAVAFDAYVAEKGAAIEEKAKAVDNAEVTEATESFMKIVGMLRSIFAATGVCSKPQDWTKIWGPVNELNKAADNAAFKSRTDFAVNRKAAHAAHGLIMLVTAPGPAQHCQATFEEMDFHCNKVLLKKIPAERDWINALKAFVKDMGEFCKEHCKMGLIWKAGGQDPVEYFTAAPLGTKAAPAAAAGGKGKGKSKGPAIPKGGVPPPPKEEEGAAPKAAPAAAPSGGGGGMAAVFEAIRAKRDNAAAGMRHVKDEEKTHKNPELRGNETAAPKPKAPAAAPKAGGRGPQKGPKPGASPEKVLNVAQNMWNITNFDGDNAVTLEGEAEVKHSIRIADCRKSIIRIKDKVKGVTIDNCVQCWLFCNDVLSVIEVVNSDRTQVFAMDGTVNMFSLDKSDGVQVRLGKASLGASIVSSKCSEMNVTIPDPDSADPDDTIEIPIPEQFESRVEGKKIKTTTSELYSG